MLSIVFKPYSQSKILSRAKHFDYYPKTEGSSKQICDHCIKHHSKLNKTSSRNIKNSSVISNKKILSDSGVFNSPKRSTDYHSSAESSISLGTEDNFELSPTFANESNANTITKKERKKDQFLEDLNRIERDVEIQRQRIQELRSELLSSDDKLSVKNVSLSSCEDVQQRLKNLEEVCRVCIRETLDYVTLYNKNQEQKLTSRPQDYQDLVDFCSQLIVEVSSKKSKKKKNRRKKIQNFFKYIVKFIK